MLVDGSAQKPMISVCLLNVLNILLPVCLCCKLKQIFCCCSKITMKTDWQSRTSRSFLKKLLLQSSTKSATVSNFLTKLFWFFLLENKAEKTALFHLRILGSNLEFVHDRELLLPILFLQFLEK